MTIPEYILDAQKLSPGKLSEKYEGTYSTWRNMKQRAKQEGHPVAPEFEQFDSFLCVMGPRPGENFTLDRFDYGNPLYGPNECRWLDKTGQANNRSTTINLTIDGQTKPLTTWAAETSQKPDTLRGRLRRGWSHREVVYGKRRTTVRSEGSFYWLEPEKAAVWEERYSRLVRSGTRTRLEFYLSDAGQEYGQLTKWSEYLEGLVTEYDATDGAGPNINIYLAEHDTTIEAVKAEVEELSAKREHIARSIEAAREHLPKKQAKCPIPDPVF